MIGYAPAKYTVQGVSMSKRQFVLVVSIAMLTIAGCASTTSSTTSKTSEVVDIKDIILTNLSGDCADYVDVYSATVTDLKLNQEFVADVDVSDDGSACYITSNDIPNYDFNDDSAHWAEPIAEQELSFTIPRNPTIADSSTDLSILFYNAVMLNGVVLDQYSNGCYSPDDASADADGNIANGCGLSVDWRLNPLGKVNFGTDSHNAHTQPGGLYHYHGNPMALFDPEETEQGSPVIGFAADGFPIYGPHYIDPATGEMLKATSGYTLKEGNRPTGDNSPGGTYDGTYIEDYEFTNAGTLDECNGMTINDQYGYYVTESYPYVMGCFKGTPDKSFFKFWSIAKWVIAGLVVLLILIITITTMIIRRRRRKKLAALGEANEQATTSESIVDTTTASNTSSFNSPHVNWSS